MNRTYRLKEGYAPTQDERICIVSFLVAYTRMGGGPEIRTGFWPAYREELALNKKTNYQNTHLQICLPVIKRLRAHDPHFNDRQFFFRDGAFTEERMADQLKALL